MALSQNFIKLSKLAFIASLLGGLVWVYYFFNPATNFFIPCPFQFITGFYCPGCGSQRAIHLLLHGEVIGAFRFNPLMLLTLPLLIYGLGVTIYNWTFGTSFRFMLFYSKLFIFGFFGLAMVYWIVRNIPYYPFNLLAPTE